MTQSKQITVGRIGAPFGVQGWVKIDSYTQPKEAIFGYLPWNINIEGKDRMYHMINHRTQGKRFVVQLADCHDCDQAKQYTNKNINIYRHQLPELPPNEYYWTDLEGLDVIDQHGTKLGKIDYLQTTGSNDIMVIEGKKRHLLPYLPEVVIAVDLEQGVMKVNWDEDD